MKRITKELVSQLLSDMGYVTDNNGKFQIKISSDIEEIDWKLILSGEEVPWFAYNRYLNEYKSIQHKKWAEDVAHRFLSVLSEKDSDREEIAKQLISLAMELSEVDISIDDILHESIMVNIGIDTGDSCNDYTANTVPPAYGADHSLKEAEWCASIIWLTKQQGHKKGELYFALEHIKHNPELIHTELMKSIANEVWSTLSIFTQLFFFARMSIYELLLLNSLLQWHYTTGKWGGYIMLNKETTTGFYSSFVGSSSATDIRLEKDVKIPIKYISEILPDSCYRYPMRRICGSTNLWENGRVTYMSLPKHFRMSMEECGFTPLKKNIRQNIDNI